MERFWSKINKDGRLQPDGSRCWEWMAAKSKQTGYGMFRINGRTQTAHRIAYQLTYGEITDGSLIRHYVCRNKPCCNPTHLLPGDDQSNADDKVADGMVPKGEAHWNTSLTEIDIIMIRMFYEMGYTQREIADVYHISRPNVSMIITRRLWSHI